LSYIRSYKRINSLLQNESFEPLINWGVRMALAGTLPVVWGMATGRMDDAAWVTLTAEAVSWVELKGSFGWRVRTLLAGAVLALVFSVVGTITGFSLWLSALCMFGTAFLATLLKNMGDRASGLAICVYLLFIICNAFPTRDVHELESRLVYIGLGAAWPVVVGIVMSAFMPAQQPFRRQIAIIWRAISALVETVTRSAGEQANTQLAADVFAREVAVRSAIDNSYQFYGRMAHQVNRKDQVQYQLAQLRKIAGLASVNVIAMGEEIEHIAVSSLDEALRVKAATLLNALKEAVGHISVYIISLQPDEKMLAVSHINRMHKLIQLIREFPVAPDTRQTIAINRVLQLSDRTARLLENALLRVDQMGKDERVFRSYSFVKTLLLLNPRHFAGNLKVLFNIDTFTTRYAIRSAVAATAALALYKYLDIERGYWLPFSVMIVIQPYFGATLSKAIDRITGTLLGGLAGGLLLLLPAGLHAKEAVLFLTFIFMVYYVRKNYSVSAFFITLNVVLLFSIEQAYDTMLLIVRALCTVGGAVLAVAAGFALLPTWDKKLLPAHLAAAIKSNYEYFLSTFFSPARTVNWTRSKRAAESMNSNAFDSFTRYMQEPGLDKREKYYDLITYNVRITRALNNIHLEQDEKKLGGDALPASPEHQARVNECLACFNRVAERLVRYDYRVKADVLLPSPDLQTPFDLNEAQMISLEKLIIELQALEEEMMG
jgi:uncharacterized membrane protein YccC